MRSEYCCWQAGSCRKQRWTNTFQKKYFFRCRHGLRRLRAIMHPHPLLFRSRGENLLQNNFSFLSFSVKITPFLKITFVSQAFPGQVHCSTSKHKDCWKRRAKKTGDFFLQQSTISEITHQQKKHQFTIFSECWKKQWALWRSKWTSTSRRWIR